MTAQSPSQPLIKIRSLVKTYPTGAGPFDALRGIDLDIYPGEYVGVIGKSGAGKTTLINMISGIDQITSGQVHVNGTAVHTLKEDALAHWRGMNLGVIYQSFNLLPMLSLRDNITLAMDFCGQYRRRKSEQKAMDLLTQVELAEHAQKPPAYISGGQKQRVAIARALANDPAMILADEPTGRLDSATADTIFEIFEALIEQGKTILMVSHDRSLAHRVDRVIELADGAIVSDNGGDHAQ
ncbi:ABC transporter ATP-binding protein [bacterium]|nr:ABC transporter ATP-binding protein [bacterium]